MKKAFLIIGLIVAYHLNAQIQGEFCQGKDTYGNQCIYFLGTNGTNYNFNIEVTPMNYSTGDKTTRYFILYSGKNFTVGPNENWIWQPGEVLIIKYSNGVKKIWKYGSKNALYGTVFKYNPSFTGTNSCFCGCTKFSESSGGHDICTCGHSFNSHKFYK